MTDTVAGAVLTIVNPVAQPQAHVTDADRSPPAKRPSTLVGATVALYWNGKQNGLDALARAKENLAARFDGVRFVELTGELGLRRSSARDPGLQRVRRRDPERLDRTAHGDRRRTGGVRRLIR